LCQISKKGKKIQDKIISKRIDINIQNMHFSYMGLEPRNFEELIEMSVFYTFAFKDTTNYNHDLQSFVKTIKSNNDYMQKEEKRNKGLIHKYMMPDLGDKFFIIETLDQSLKLFKKEKEKEDSYNDLQDDKMIEYLESELILKLESDSVNMRKAMKNDPVEKVKTTNMANLITFLSNEFSKDESVNAIKINNKIMKCVMEKRIDANELMLAKKKSI